MFISNKAFFLFLVACATAVLAMFEHERAVDLFNKLLNLWK
jgi:hypothetical protein